jgi:hypothetical protein
MTENNEPMPEPEPQTESSGAGSGRPPIKTALGYSGFDDEDRERMEREEERRHRELIRQREGEPNVEEDPTMDAERMEFRRRWREKYPLPAGTTEGIQKKSRNS